MANGTLPLWHGKWTNLARLQRAMAASFSKARLRRIVALIAARAQRTHEEISKFKIVDF